MSDELMTYLLELSIWDFVLMSAAFVLWCYLMYFALRYLDGVRRRRSGSGAEKKDNLQIVESSNLQIPKDMGVTVVVCARNEAAHLEPYLQSLLTQDYPEYEVIVVNDGSQDNTREVIEQYERQYEHLHTTFVPAGARVQSTKKLALTLAAKAAKYDYLLLTDADCRPESSHWISEMMRPFGQEGIEVVLGYGGYFYEPGKVNRLTRYDTLYTGLLYLGAAIAGHPYMGVGRNLAYSKQLFFRSGGFSDLMHVRSGDDDLFVNKVANRKNTAVVLSPDSITWSESKHTWHDWIIQRRRHLSVSPGYRPATKLWLAAEPAIRGLFYVSLILIGVFGHPIAWLAGLLLGTIRGITIATVINRGAHTLGERMFNPWRLWWYDISMPLLTLYLMSTNRSYRKLKW
ncbi:MAG: glycosyltransferase [Paludibacteraceae bacterium]|nr:glycosyltransferase [Paludibacteraceae bacterium]